MVPLPRSVVSRRSKPPDFVHLIRLPLAQGEHPKVIQERLGPASIKTTLDTYGHLSDGLDEAAADRVDEAWRAPHTEPATNRASGGKVIKLENS